MDEVVIEYRGIAGELAVGDSLIVESCEAGVLRLRRAPIEVEPAPAAVASGDDAKGDADV